MTRLQGQARGGLRYRRPVFVCVGAITASYNEPKPPLYLRPEPLPREGNMGEENVGITVFDLGMESGALLQIQEVRGLRNPTFLAVHPTCRLCTRRNAKRPHGVR